MSCSLAFGQNIVKRGFVDLKAYPEAENQIALDGEWEFYWNQLIDPEDFATQKVTYAKFPSLWKADSLNLNPMGSFGYATYRVRLVLPDTGNYSLLMEDVYSSYRLYFNGRQISANGQVATSKDNYKPEWRPEFIDLVSPQDTNELVLQIANFDHAKGGPIKSILVGRADKMHAMEINRIAYDLLLTGSLIMGGLFFLGLYLFGRHDRAILYFSLFCITYSYRIIGFGYYVLHHLINIPWFIAIRLEYITLFLSTYLFGLFIKELYPQESGLRIWKPISIICLSFTAITLIFPPVVFSHLIVPFFIILVIYLGLTLYVYIMAYLNRRPGSRYTLAVTGILFAVFIYNILVYFDFLTSWPSGSFLGYMLFFFSQSLILSFRFADSLKKARDLAELASQAKSDFLSTISHEIRTPLNAVVGISHLLIQENPRPDQTENLTSLRFSAEHLTSLINDILDYNKLESGSVEFEEMQVNLAELTDRIQKSYLPKAAEKNLKLVYELDESISKSLIMDATRMSQVLGNLLDNAIKFTAKGFVSLRVSLVEDHGDAQTVKFEIGDSGIGIDADKLDFIFQRFTQASSSTTREYGGSGLGLSIIKRILQLQGVQIQVSSVPGEGSVFYFQQVFKISKLLPVQQEEGIGDYTEVNLDGKRVLLVEDNAMNVLVAEKFLKSWGLKLDFAENGLIAVEKAATEAYDIILMDLQMPEMDGYQAARLIRKQNSKVPIVALTASALIQVQEKVLSSGMNDYITKPFDPKELRRKLVKNILTT